MRRESRLQAEISPYLLQHAQNPVDWFPWGDEALERARTENKPILLSIGYAACHFCHVMARESFEDEAIAAQMNENFVCVKVDREERPDLDEIYMAAALALSGRGGWPLTVFLTPEREPFFAGTYFPPHDGERGLGFSTLLTRIAEMWNQERESLRKQAGELSTTIRSRHVPLAPTSVSSDTLFAATRVLQRDFDPVSGGFGTAPKFPAPAALSFLMRQSLRPGQGELVAMVRLTLDAMMSGGLYDQLGGGFARYSTDNQWLVPHFEKMLSDNAQLIDVYLEGFQLTGNAAYRRIARETVEYLLREMRSPAGGFFSASDAESDGEEGGYFLWTPRQVRDTLGEPRATHFCEFFGISEDGNFRGKNVLSTRQSLQRVSRDLGVSETELIASIDSGRALLLEARQARVAPGVDDKILCGHNGLVIRALANAARVLGEPSYLQAARQTAEFLLGDGTRGAGMSREDGGVFRAFRAGQAKGLGFLEDHAFLADGLLALYEAGGGRRYLGEAERLARILQSDFAADNGAFYGTSHQHEALLSRPLSGHDEALPSANAVCARLFSRLSVHTADRAHEEQALRIVQAFSTGLKRSPRAYCTLLCVVDFLLQPPVEVVVNGLPGDDNLSTFTGVLASQFLPHRVEAHLRGPDDELSRSPLLKGRFAHDGSVVHVCVDSNCLLPVDDPAQLPATLREAVTQSERARKSELLSRLTEGRATPEGTAEHRRTSSLPDTAFAPWGDFWVSRLGLGTHRVGLDQVAHERALRRALARGINLIDTSPTFALGDSERLIGQVVRDLISSNEVQRQHLVVVSKVGVALGPLAAQLEERRKLGTLPEATVPLSTSGPRIDDAALDSGAFCLDPDFLTEQIDGSRARLGLAHLDVCLIQSPEHLLAAGADRATLRAALTNAFVRLEALVEAGKIGAYGVFSNTLSEKSAPLEPLALSLLELLELVEKAVGPQHHFRAVELPVNLVENGALRRGVDSSGDEVRSLVERAQEAGLAVFGCRPLSAMSADALLRLVDPPASSDREEERNLSAARYRVASLEAEFETTFAAALRLSGRVGPGAVLPLSGPLGHAVEKVATWTQFQQAEATMITPRLRQLLGQLDQAFQGSHDAAWKKFREKYIQAVGLWLACVRHRALDRTRERLEQVAEATAESPFAARLPRNWGELPWHTRALLPLLNEPSLTSTLVGLRSETHADEALALLGGGAPPTEVSET